MVMVRVKKIGLWVALTAVEGWAGTLEMTVNDIKKLAGCYVVDYSYSETAKRDPSYTLDTRVYDVSRFTVKELIKVVDEKPDSIRLQHFMQADDFSGNTVFKMRHHGEIWHKQPDYRYLYRGRFEGNDRWSVEDLTAHSGHWVRETLSLDDGPRYHCLGRWLDQQHFPRFECTAFAPIPGRETRDMGRRDYNTMERKSEVILYQGSWLEKQSNTKIRFDHPHIYPLVDEVGKIWSVKVDDSQCHEVETWAEERQPFWNLLAVAWSTVLDGSRSFNELKQVNGSSRGEKINELMQQYYKTVKTNPDHAETVSKKLASIIEMHQN